MKKIILNTVLFVALLVLADFAVGVTLNLLYNKVSENPNSDIPGFTFNKVDSDVLVIGSSRAHNHYVSSILADSLNLSVYNCGRGGALFYYQACQIDAILRRHTPKIIIWELVSPNLLSETTDSAKEREFNLFNSLYPLYDSNNFIDSMLCLKGKYEWIKLKSASFRYNSKSVSMVKQAIISEPDLNNGYQSLANEGYKFPIKAKNMYHNNISTDREHLFIETINKCLAQDVELILTLSPYLAESNYKETDSYKIMVKISEENGIKLIDYYHDNAFVNDSTLFKDNLHLNGNGAIKYTQEIAGHLKGILFDEQQK